MSVRIYKMYHLYGLGFRYDPLWKQLMFYFHKWNICIKIGTPRVKL